MGEELSKALTSDTALYSMMGLSSGMEMGSSIASSHNNANSSRVKAKSVLAQSELNADLIRRQYAVDYRELASRQERVAAARQVAALKHGSTGDSANAAMQAHAAKDQLTKDRLYHTTAIRTGHMSLQAAGQARELLERARQYDWQATTTVVNGALNTGMVMIDYARKNPGASSASDPVSAANAATAGGNPGQYIQQWGFLDYGPFP